MICNKEFLLDVLELHELERGPIYAKLITASGLKRFIRNNDVKEMFVTSTLPNVYVQISQHLFTIPYRPFLSFLSGLYEIEEETEINWLRHGF